MAGMKVQLVQEYVEKEQALIRESYRRRDEIHHLHHLILIKTDEREQKSRELLKAQVIYNTLHLLRITFTSQFAFTQSYCSKKWDFPAHIGNME